VIELVGYLASGLVALAYLMRSDLKLRLVSTIGAVTFIIYGILIDSFPVIITNGFIALTNCLFFYQNRSRSGLFELMHIEDLKNPLLHRFLDYYGNDIKKFFPDFDPSKINNPEVVFLFRDLIPVGLFVCSDQGSGDFEIHLDYVIPTFRDRKTAQFLFHRRHHFDRRLGIKRYVIKSDVAMHQKYLGKIGFVKQETATNGKPVYTYTLSG